MVQVRLDFNEQSAILFKYLAEEIAIVTVSWSAGNSNMDFNLGRMELSLRADDTKTLIFG